MIIVRTNDCRPGMELGRSIYTEQGHVLAGRGFHLTEHAIRKLSELGLPFLHIEEAGTEDIAPDQAIRDETIIVLHGALSHVMDELGASGKRETLSPSVVRFCHDAARLLVGDLRDRRHQLCLPVHLTTMLADGDKQHFLEHALNVGVCATRLGLEEGLSLEELHELAMGAMLHDVGRLLLPGGLQSKGSVGNLAEYRSHTELGYRLLRDSGFPLMTAHCALFHHERIDGSGYPHGVEGGRIHPLIQWISMFDMFDTLVNGRGNGAPMLPHEALEVLYGGAGMLYDLEKVRRMRDNLALFPRGTTVRLSSGEIGVVCDFHEDSKQRPIIRVIRSPDGNVLKHPYEVDLKRQLHLMISGVGSSKGGQQAEIAPSVASESQENRSNRVFHVV